MTKKLLLPLALLIGIVWDVLFWGKAPGVSFPLFIVVSLASAIFLLRSEGIRPAKASVFLMVAVVLLAVFTFIRTDPLTNLLSYAFSLLFAVVLAATYHNGAWTRFNLSGYIRQGFAIFGGLIVFPWKFLFFETRASDEADSAQKKSAILPVLRGLLLAVPVLLVFTLLLSSADMVFSQRVEALLESFRIERIDEYFTQGIVALMIAYMMIGLVKIAEVYGQKAAPRDSHEAGMKPFLGFTEGATVLIAVMVLFSVFVAIQFRYFFSGEMNISETGFTYAEYARRGFGELIWVAVFSLLMIQVLRTVLKIDMPKQRKLLTGLVIGLVSLTLVILVSSYQRLSLYESAYGFSRLRSYSHFFILWLGLLLAGTVVLEVLKQPRAFANAVLAATLGFVLTLNLINVDAFIVQQNLKRAEQDMELDAQYLTSLSSDAVPGMMDAFNNEAHPADIRDQIGAALACQNARLMSEAEESYRNRWPSFNLADWKARQALEVSRAAISQYPIRSDDYSTTIVLPDGEEFYCQMNMGFD
jgi:hypothetical protein